MQRCGSFVFWHAVSALIPVPPCRHPRTDTRQFQGGDSLNSTQFVVAMSARQVEYGLELDTKSCSQIEGDFYRFHPAKIRSGTCVYTQHWADGGEGQASVDADPEIGKT